jgi:hypothetical protein
VSERQRGRGSGLAAPQSGGAEPPRCVNLAGKAPCCAMRCGRPDRAPLVRSRGLRDARYVGSSGTRGSSLPLPRASPGKGLLHTPRVTEEGRAAACLEVRGARPRRKAGSGRAAGQPHSSCRVATTVVGAASTPSRFARSPSTKWRGTERRSHVTLAPWRRWQWPSPPGGEGWVGRRRAAPPAAAGSSRSAALELECGCPGPASPRT